MRWCAASIRTSIGRAERFERLFPSATMSACEDVVMGSEAVVRVSV